MSPLPDECHVDSITADPRMVEGNQCLGLNISDTVRSETRAILDFVSKRDLPRRTNTSDIVRLLENEYFSHTDMENHLPEYDHKVLDKFYLTPFVLREFLLRAHVEDGWDESKFKAGGIVKNSIERYYVDTREDGIKVLENMRDQGHDGKLADIVDIDDLKPDGFWYEYDPPTSWKEENCPINTSVGCLCPHTAKVITVNESVPSCIKKFKDIEKLKIEKKGTKFPHALFSSMFPVKGMNVREIDLSGNKFEWVPSGMHHLGNIEKLDVSDTLMKDFRDIFDIRYLDGITHLVADRSSMKMIRGIDHLVNLENLSMKDSKLWEISGLENNKKLEGLDLSKKWDHVDESERDGRKEIHQFARLKHLKNLTVLDLAGNSIESILSKELIGLKNLLFLNLNGNKMRKFPPITKLKNIEALHLDGNDIKTVPIRIKSDSLKVLDLKSNKLKGFKDLSRFPSLVHLDLNYNNIKGNNKIGYYGEDNRNFYSNIPLQHLRFLGLSGNKLWDFMGYGGDFLHTIANPNTLKELDINWTGMAEEVLLGFKNLEVLKFNVSGVRDIGSVLTLTNLKELSLDFNNLTRLKGLENLKKLEILSVQHNKITSVGDFGSFPKLWNLQLSGNHIEDISKMNFANLKKLHYFKLDNNYLTTISNMTELSELRTLNLEKNKFKDVPLVEHFPKGMMNIFLGGNFIPKDKCNKFRLDYAKESTLKNEKTVKCAAKW